MNTDDLVLLVVSLFIPAASYLSARLAYRAQVKTAAVQEAGVDVTAKAQQATEAESVLRGALELRQAIRDELNAVRRELQTERDGVAAIRRELRDAQACNDEMTKRLDAVEERAELAEQRAERAETENHLLREEVAELRRQVASRPPQARTRSND